jgi:uncharacterized membrane protein YGL010W
MRTVESLFADYASYHRTPGNKAFHRIGIPLIMLTLIGLLVRVSFTIGGTRLDAAMILIAVSTIYYLAIEWRLAIAMLAVSIGFYFLGAAMPLWLNAALFILGWIFQFIGHSVYEHRQPAFFRNFLHLLVGPLWILNDLLPVVRTTRTT